MVVRWVLNRTYGQTLCWRFEKEMCILCWECTVCAQTLGEISGREQQAIVNMCALEGRKCVHNVRQGGNICVGKKCMHMQQGGFTGPGHGQRLTRNNMCSTSAQAWTDQDSQLKLPNIGTLLLPDILFIQYVWSLRSAEFHKLECHKLECHKLECVHCLGAKYNHSVSFFMCVFVVHTSCNICESAGRVP